MTAPFEISHKQIIAVLDWIGKEHDRTMDYAGKTCIFGVGLPSAIASHRMKMLTDLINIIDEVRKRETSNE